MAKSGISAEIVTSGTEILLGDIVDTNAAWIAQQLRDTGVNLYYKTTVGDNEGRLRGVLELGMSRSDVIIVTGGLGPTADDITRQAIANATGRPLRLHDGALRTLQERFVRFGATMTDNNRQQAMIPEGATLIENPVGTAPGFIVETTCCAVIALPGVPREMKRLMTDTVLPYLSAKTGANVIRRRILRTIGIGESSIDNLLGELMNSANPTIGTAAHLGQCDVRIAARGATADEVEALLDQMESTVRDHIGKYVYSTTPGESYDAVVARRLEQHGATVTLLESNTGGAVANRLTTAATAGGLVTAAYTISTGDLPSTLSGLLDAENSAGNLVSQHTAEEVAQALFGLSSASFAVAILGTSGTDEGVYERRSGETWLALATGGTVTSMRIPFGGVEEFAATRIGNQALIMIDRALTNLPVTQ
jgi:nicotinamide-nucleotide amidase